MKIFNILDYGVKSGADTLQTKEIQAAIDDCFLSGGGEVIVPDGTYLTGDIRLRSNITLHLLENARIVGSRNPLDYFNHRNDKIEPLAKDRITDKLINNSAAMSADIPKNISELKGTQEFEKWLSGQWLKKIPSSRWMNAIIRAIDAENVKIVGERGSVIDGANCYDPLGEGYCRGPHAINFFGCKNICFEGYAVKDSANWAHNILYCDNVVFKNVTVEAGHDGIDVSGCSNVSIVGCRLYTGDDCIAGFANTNVFISGCELNSSCSTLRFGGTNVFVSKCRMYGPGKFAMRGLMTDEEKKSSAPSKSGWGPLAAFTYYASYSLDIDNQPGNIIISDCKIENADKILHYNYSGTERWQLNRPLADITFENTDADNIKYPMILYGDEVQKITLKLDNMNISFSDKVPSDSLIHACNYERIILKNVNVRNLKGENVIKVWSDGETIFENVDAGDAKCGVAVQKSEFITNAI